MSAYPFMRFYFGDYLSKTHSLTTLQHGAYLLLLAAMWGSHGYVTDDDDELARIVRLRVRDWKRIRPAMEHLFVIENGRITQRRLLEEYTRAAGKSAAAIIRGSLGGQAKARVSKNQKEPQHSNHEHHNHLKYNGADLEHAKHTLSKRVAKPDKDIITSLQDAEAPEGKSDGGADVAPLEAAPLRPEPIPKTEPPPASKSYLLETGLMQGKAPFLPRKKHA